MSLQQLATFGKDLYIALCGSADENTKGATALPVTKGKRIVTIKLRNPRSAFDKEVTSVTLLYEPALWDSFSLESSGCSAVFHARKCLDGLFVHGGGNFFVFQGIVGPGIGIPSYGKHYINPLTNVDFQWLWADRLGGYFAIQYGLTKGSCRGAENPEIRCRKCGTRCHGRTVEECVYDFHEKCHGTCFELNDSKFYNAWRAEYAKQNVLFDHAPRKKRKASPNAKAKASPAADMSKRTTFKGVTYASRLEAQWAHVFDRLAVNFSYEPCMVTSVGINKLLAHEPGRGDRRYYKPDFHLIDMQTAIEVKPNAPSRRERMLCQEFARCHGPIVILYGGGTRGNAEGFVYPTVDERSMTDPGVPCAPHALRCESRDGVVTMEAVYLGKSWDGTWGFLPLAQFDATMTNDDLQLLRTAHIDAATANFT